MEQMKDLKFKDEIKKMEYEPMNATEVSLVRNSLLLGVGLLIFFYIISNTVFPDAHHVNQAAQQTITTQSSDASAVQPEPAAESDAK